MRAAVTIAVLMATTPPALAQNAGESAVVFRWQALPGAAGYIIEIAEDREFTKVVVSEQTTKNEYSWRRLARQNYYYRVRAVGADGRKGKFSPIRVMGLVVTPPKLTAPKDGAVFRIGAQDARIKASWAKETLLSQYVVEVATSESFSEFVLQTTVATTSHSFSLSKPGNYYVRVSGLDLNGQPIKAKSARKFSIEVGPPILVSPELNESIAARTTDTPVELTWSKRPVNAYQVQWADNPGFNHAMGSAKTTSPSHTITAASSSTLYWRVRGRSPDTQWSSVGSFTITMPIPRIETPVSGSMLQTEAINVSWTPVPGASEYLLEATPVVSEGLVPQVVVLKVSDATTAILKLTRGTSYVLTAKAVDGRGEESAPSPPVRFQVSLPATVATPTLVAPAADASVPIDPTDFTWKAVNGAETYALQVSSSPSFATTIHDGAYKQPRARLSIAAPGKYYWRVRTHGNDDARSPWSHTRAIEVVAAPPELGRTAIAVAPAVGLVHNFGEVLSPSFTAVLTARPTWLNSSLRFGASVSWYTSSTQVDDTNSGIKLDSRVHVMPMELSASWLIDAAGFAFYGGPQASVSWVYATVQGDTQPQLTNRTLTVGAGVHVGAERTLGSGVAFFQSGYGFYSKVDGIVELRPGGLTATLGYRIGLRN